MTAATADGKVAAEEIIRRHQAGVWRYLRFLGAGETQAEDLTQETFLAILRRPFEYRGREEAGAYLRKVARNQFLMAMRRQRRRPQEQALEAAEAVWVAVAGEGGGDELLDALDPCLAALQGKAKQAIEMRYRGDRSRAEIASALDMTEDGVKTLLRRTRAKLRQCVERSARHS